MNVTPKLGKGLGRKADAPDARDYPLGDHGSPLHEIGALLPSSTDVFAGLSLPVYDQGSIGSCTANAGVLYRRFLAQRFARYSAPDENLSRLFLYYQERKLPWNDDVNSDAGASIRDVLYVLAHTGVCPEKDDPYIPADYSSASLNDSPADVVQAQAYRIGAYHRISGAADVRSVLASGYPVLLGFTAYPSIEEVGPDGVVPMPGPAEPPLGGHAVVIRGYDDVKASFRIQNSWGTDWGNRGCGWLPYAFIEQAAVSHPDLWMGHLGKPWGK